MKKFERHEGLLTPSECDWFHQTLLSDDYSNRIGFYREMYHYNDKVQPSSPRKLALQELAYIIQERVVGFDDFTADKWKAAVNTWSCARLVQDVPRMGKHRDDIGADVAAISIHGSGTFIVGRAAFPVVPGDVVVMHNRRILAPRHDVIIESDERMSVAMWRA